jgi:hypothetical protein
MVSALVNLCSQVKGALGFSGKISDLTGGVIGLITGMMGVTGAGLKPCEKSLFLARSSTVPYGCSFTAKLLLLLLLPMLIYRK